MDKYTATWLSHSSISDFQHCPRAYYLNNVYKDPRTGHKVSTTSPAMALGSAVHQVLESLSTIPVTDRFKISLHDRLEEVWGKFAGKMGGFLDQATEDEYKKKATEILTHVTKNKGPLERLAVKIKMDLPNYWLSEDDGIILCGKLDWLEYNESEDSVHIIDFKTGKSTEKPGSLQLPIYHLLAHNCQTRPVARVSYWYVARDNTPVEQELPDLDHAAETLLKIGKEIKLARSLERFKCPEGDGGCRYCKPFERIIKGDAEFVGVSGYNQDMYILTSDSSPDSEIL
jgi:RecB family exonuclease